MNPKALRQNPLKTLLPVSITKKRLPGQRKTALPQEFLPRNLHQTTAAPEGRSLPSFSVMRIICPKHSNNNSEITKRGWRETILFFMCKALNYSIMEDTTPEPTVLPPSRIAKRRPCSIAMGVINSMVILMLSPGITISTPSGSIATPVTSVVLK